MSFRSYKYDAIVLGVSAGGFKTIPLVIKGLKESFRLPVIAVQHSSPDTNLLVYKNIIEEISGLTFEIAEEKKHIQPGYFYMAPPNYHLLIEENKTFALNVDEKVSYARPSIDVLFESAADVYLNKLIAVVLTGANSDGTEGAKYIKKNGGIVVVENPETAIADVMPKNVALNCEIDFQLEAEKFPELLIKLSMEN